MTVNDFIRLREKDWERLQFLIRKRRGRSRLTANEVRELGRLYRAVSSDLALARRDYPGQRVTIFLNQLLTRVHSYVYQQDVSDYRSALRYFTHSVPQTFRRTGRFTLFAFALFLIPAIIGFHLGRTDPDVADTLGLSRVRETLENESIWTNIPIEDRPYASAFIMSNNIRVAILAFGGGMAFGLFAIYIMVINGVHLGAVMGLAVHYGMGQELLDFVFAHGVIEVSVIFISGGAGMQIGWALMNPGLYSRRDAVSITASRALPLAVMAVPLLIVAGIIEGFISPSDASFASKLMVGLGSGVLMYSYLLFSGRIGQKPGQPT